MGPVEPHRPSPARSVLHRLRPAGFGTPFVESAESYLSRLAGSHRVERSSLQRYVNECGTEIYGGMRGQPARIDAPTANAWAFMQRTAQLVSQPEVALLGLGWLAGFGESLASQLCLRRERAWCALCFKQMAAEGVPMHTPLQWTFVQIPICAIHRCRLSDQCAGCGKQSSVAREKRQQVGLCDFCGTALWLSDVDAATGYVVDTAQGCAVSEQLGLLFGSARVNLNLRRPTFADLVLRLHREGHVVSSSELARRLGKSKGTISDLMSGRGQPSLDLLLRLATALAVPLPDLLSDCAGRDGGVRSRRVEHDPLVWPARPRPRKDWIAVQRAFEFEAASSAPVSLPRFAKAVGVDPKHLNVTLPEATRAHRQRKREAIAKTRTDEVADASAKIAEANRDGVTSQRRIAGAIGIGRSRRCFKKAWRVSPTDG